ncbi:hypothetical protein SDC9_85354 [bioreactor metagenome]|uniref:Uncharacterized protein n=1 Tax=bioreactor metagenome TaxID=1076179 RepID=A0A644ZLU4_9ZZZZ
MHDHVGAEALPLTFRNGVPVRAGGLPQIGGVGAVFLCHHRDVVGHHKRGVKTHAELADDVGVFGVVPHLLPELKGAGGGNDPQIAFKVLLVHADAIVGHGEDAPGLVRLELNFKILAPKAHVLIRQRPVTQLVAGVAGVGNDLPEKNLVMGVDGVHHQIEKSLGLRLELSLCHG